MRIVKSMALAATLIAAVSMQSRADDQDFVGTWTGEIIFLVELDGKIIEAPRHWIVVIEKVEDGLVSGFNHWTSKDATPGNVAGVNVLDAAEPVIGTVDADDPVIRLVETDDYGTLLCELLGPDELEATYMESYPHAVVGTTVLHRQSE
jgi:hypothetical protein